jgi:hypothetical protein
VIDEASPSEDERAAEDFLKNSAPPRASVIGDSVRYFLRNKIQLTSGLQDEQPSWDVLVQHHKKNRSNRAPELARLSTAALHQLEAKKHGRDDPEETDDAGEQNEDQDHSSSRAARHSKSTGEVKADTLTYYKGTPWAEILRQAKIKYRRHIALNHGFPDRDEHLCDAREILFEAIEEFKSEHGILDQSGSIYFIYVHIH